MQKVQSSFNFGHSLKVESIENTKDWFGNLLKLAAQTLGFGLMWVKVQFSIMNLRWDTLNKPSKWTTVRPSIINGCFSTLSLRIYGQSSVMHLMLSKVSSRPSILSLVEGYAEDELLLDAFKSAADASPEHGKIQWLTAILFDTKERYQQSSKYFRAALDAGEDHIHIYHQLSDNLQQLGEHSRVQAVLLEGIKNTRIRNPH